jgi:hypothetical protein
MHPWPWSCEIRLDQASNDGFRFLSQVNQPVASLFIAIKVPRKYRTNVSARHGLRKVVVHARLEAGLACAAVDIAGEPDHRHARASELRFLAAPVTSRRQAVHSWHMAVHEHQVDGSLLQ